MFLLVLTLAIAAVVIGFYKYLDAREMREKGQRYPMSEMVRRPLPPRPRLQTYPFTDITALRTEERKLLDEYAWVDKNAGVVRIPIERAIEVLAERGLPHRAAPPAGTPPRRRRTDGAVGSPPSRGRPRTRNRRVIPALNPAAARRHGAWR